MQDLTFRAFRKDNIYFRTIEEREKIKEMYTRVPGDWESSPTACDPNQATAHAFGEVQFILGSAVNRYENMSMQYIVIFHGSKTE